MDTFSDCVFVSAMDAVIPSNCSSCRELGGKIAVYEKRLKEIIGANVELERLVEQITTQNRKLRAESIAYLDEMCAQTACSNLATEMLSAENNRLKTENQTLAEMTIAAEQERDGAAADRNRMADEYKSLAKKYKHLFEANKLAQREQSVDKPTDGGVRVDGQATDSSSYVIMSAKLLMSVAVGFGRKLINLLFCTL